MAVDLLSQLQAILGDAYKVDRELGGAGMSRVFLAHEVELEREVVVKVLPPDLAAGLSVDRFRREIQLAARLQHPHIVPLLSAGAKGGLLFYTMPFIKGENLRARLVRLRELPIPDATKILREVADALEYAHENGIVHRDIKPENILFSGSHALVTDFGVSKALSSATSETRVEAAGSSALTSLGVALGTPAYMAPEQAAADPNVDHRADIYSLGAVGYEMLTGRPLFSGMTPQQVLSAQVTAQPEAVTRHRPNIPPALAATIMRCLEKHPSDRWQTATELRVQLESIFTPSGVTHPVPALRRPLFRMTPRRVMVAAAVAGVVAAGVALSTSAFRHDASAYAIGRTRQITNFPGVELYPAVSPDGKMVAYVANRAGKPQLFVRQINGGRPVALADDKLGAFWPRWKPDGSELIYNSDEGVVSVPALGGSPRVLIAGANPNRLPRDTDTAGAVGYGFCDWAPDGSAIVCTNVDDGALYRLDANGANPQRLTPPGGEAQHSITWSPDGQRVAYVQGNVESLVWGTTLGNLAASSIWIVPATGGTPTRITDLIHHNTSPVWARDGSHVLFVSSLGGPRDIYSQRVNGKSEPVGEPDRLTTGLQPHSISISADGAVLAYSAFRTSANIWTARLNGTARLRSETFRQITSGDQTIEAVSVSKDERWLAFDSNLNGNSDIFRLPVEGGDPQQLTRDPADEFAPSWSPDGSQVAFHSFRNGNRDIFVASSNGSRTETVAGTTSDERTPKWSPDGRQIAYQILPESIFVARRAGAGWSQPRFLVLGHTPSWDRNGNVVAFFRDAQLATVAPDGGQLTFLTGLDALRFGPVDHIAWSRDSRLLYYATADENGMNRIMVVSSRGGTPTPIWTASDPLRQLYRPYVDVDSKNIYFTLGARESDIWVMELKRK